MRRPLAGATRLVCRRVGRMHLQALDWRGHQGRARLTHDRRMLAVPNPNRKHSSHLFLQHCGQHDRSRDHSPAQELASPGAVPSSERTGQAKATSRTARPIPWSTTRLTTDLRHVEGKGKKIEGGISVRVSLTCNARGKTSWARARALSGSPLSPLSSGLSPLQFSLFGGWLFRLQQSVLMDLRMLSYTLPRPATYCPSLTGSATR